MIYSASHRCSHATDHPALFRRATSPNRRKVRLWTRRAPTTDPSTSLTTKSISAFSTTKLPTDVTVSVCSCLTRSFAARRDPETVGAAVPHLGRHVCHDRHNAQSFAALLATNNTTCLQQQDPALPRAASYDTMDGLMRHSDHCLLRDAYGVGGTCGS